MGQIAGSAYNMGVGLGLASYQYSVAQILLGDESYLAAKNWWKKFAEATNRDKSYSGNPINLDENEILNDYHGSHMKMIEGIRSYLSDNLPKNGHPWLEMGIWIGIAEGQSTSPELKSVGNSVPRSIIQDCRDNIVKAIQTVPSFVTDILDIVNLLPDVIDKTVLHSNLETIRKKLSSDINNWPEAN